MRLTTISMLAAVLASAPAAQAQMIRAQDPQGLVKVMTDNGYSATLGTDGTGDPMISSKQGETAFTIFFYNCTRNKECATIQLNAGYDLAAGAVSFETMNAWNRSQRFGRAFLDKDGDPKIQMDVDLDDGGISKALFIDNLQFWASLLPRFEEHIGWGK